MADEQDRIRAQRAAAAAAKAAADAAARQARMDELKAEREKRMAEEAKARAASDPLKDPTNRPEAPQLDDGFIRYYSWIGGGTTGQWKLYKEPADSAKAASAEARSTGGATQAQFGSSVGANALATTTGDTPTASTSSDALYDAKRAAGYGIDAQGKPITTSSDSLYAAKYAAGYGMDAQGNQYRGLGTATDLFTINGQPFTGTWQGKTYENGIIKTTTASTSTASTTTASIFGSVEGTSTTRTLGRDQFKNSLALFFGAAEAAKPWVDALYDVVSKFYRTGSDVNESFNLALQDARNNPALKPFTDRFKGIYALQDLKLTGKPVLVPTIAEYVVSQAKMADVLREANLGDIATDDFTTELISKGNSVTTIAEKIAKAYQRIDMAPKAIKDTFSRYFPTVDRTKLAKTLLLGEKGVNELVDELETFEVLASAEQQGLGAINRIGGVDLGRAQEYARSGQTYASLTPQFSRIARALPTTTKLSQISKVEDIGQVGLEKALISQSAKELEQLELLGEQEMARYSGKAGRLELGLASQRRANRAF